MMSFLNIFDYQNMFSCHFFFTLILRTSALNILEVLSAMFLADLQFMFFCYFQ